MNLKSKVVAASTLMLLFLLLVPLVPMYVVFHTDNTPGLQPSYSCTRGSGSAAYYLIGVGGVLWSESDYAFQSVPPGKCTAFITSVP